MNKIILIIAQLEKKSIHAYYFALIEETESSHKAPK